MGPSFTKEAAALAAPERSGWATTLVAAVIVATYGLFAGASARAAAPPKRWSEADLVKAYSALKAAGELEAAVRSPTLPKEPPQATFLDALAWYAAGTPSQPGVLTRTDLDRFVDDQVRRYLDLLAAKVEQGADNDYPRTRTWKIIQKMALVGEEMSKPERRGEYPFPALDRVGGEAAAADVWDRDHTIRTAEEFRERVCGASYARPVLVKFGNTNCTQCMLFELTGSVQDLAESPGLKGKVDVFKVWFGFRPDEGFAGRIKDPARLDDLAKGEGISSSPTFAVYRNGRRYTCGDAFPDPAGHDEKLEACVRQEFGEAPIAAACTVPAAAVPPGPAALGGTKSEESKEEVKLKLTGDVRFRTEADWDSLQADGTERSDRDRFRVRFRFGFTYAFDEHYSFGGRIRSGVGQDQQSPHQTLGDEFETKPVNIDKAYLQGSWKHGWVWAGKNAFTFWTQNEILWDEDVTPEGIAGGVTWRFGQSHWRLKPVLGYFVMETALSSNQIDDKSDLVAAQLALEGSYDTVDLTFAADSYTFYDNPDTTDVALVDLDYQVWHGGAKAAFKTGWKPWSIGVDYMKNTEDYPDTLFNRDQTKGYVVGLSLGRLRERKDWLVAYYYAHIEKFAIVARLGQDDWLRWGSATDTRSSNFEGHEFRVAYVFRPNVNVMLRVYVVEGIALETPTAVELEDGKRARLDFNMSF